MITGTGSTNDDVSTVNTVCGRACDVFSFRLIDKFISSGLIIALRSPRDVSRVSCFLHAPDFDRVKIILA